jgi:hypothetical protein
MVCLATGMSPAAPARASWESLQLLFVAGTRQGMKKMLFSRSGEPSPALLQAENSIFGLSLSIEKDKSFVAFYEMTSTIAAQGDRTENLYGRRHATNLQRLWAGLHLHRCRSGVLSGTRVLDAETLQALPTSQEKRSRWLGLPFRSFSGNPRHLFGMRATHDGAVRAPR